MKIELNPKIYPLEAVLNACYVFMDRAYLFLDRDPKSENIYVFLKGKGKLSEKELDALRGEFMNELLHCALRFNISKENKKIREYIIGRALCSALLAPDLAAGSEKLSYQEDPLGIAVPWEEKYGKNKKHAKSRV